MVTSDFDTAVRTGDRPALAPDPVVPAPTPPTSTLYDVPVARSRLGLVVTLTGAGLLLVGLADALARTGHEGPVIALFSVGVLSVFLSCAWRLVSRRAQRRERLILSVVVGCALLLAFYMQSPLIFDGFDELLHGTTLHALLAQRTLAVHNSLVPVSPYYPGLELLTVATKWLTGLPLVLAQLVVLLAVRVVLVLGIFLVVERLCRSSLAGGVGVLVFAANPQFYAFDSQYSYETLALALAVAAVWYLLSATDSASATASVPRNAAGRPCAPADRRLEARGHRHQLMALACITALVFTHHLTAWLTTGFLVVWYAANRIEGHRREARVVGTGALTAVVLCLGWTAFVGGHILTYLGPIFRAAIAGFGSAIGQLHSERQLFHTSSGVGGATSWEIAAMLSAAALWCLVLGSVAYDELRMRRGGRRISLIWVPLVVAAGYPVALATSLSANSSEVGQRATTFIFFGMAVCVGAWVARRVSSPAPPVQRELMGLVAGLCFLGSLLFGAGPAVTLVPGPYMVGADSLSLGAPSIALAEWASTHLPAGTNVAADRDNGVLLADMAHVNVVTAIGGLVNPGSIFFDPRLTPFDTKLIREGHIHYIVTDLRLARSLPLFGTYIEPGESKPGVRLTRAELTKFQAIPGVQRVYDNGDIQVYDLSTLEGTSTVSRVHATGTTVSPKANTGTAADEGNLAVFLVAVAVVLVAVRARLRRSRRGPRAPEEGVLTGIVALMLFGIAFAALAVPSGISPVVVGITGLAILAAWSFGAARYRNRVSDADDRPARAMAIDRRGRHWAGVLAGVALAAGGVGLAAGFATREWRPVPALSLVSATPSHTVVDVLPGAVGGTVTATYFGGPTVSKFVPPGSKVTRVALPSHLGPALVRLVSDGPARTLFLWGATASA